MGSCFLGRYVLISVLKPGLALSFANTDQTDLNRATHRVRAEMESPFRKSNYL